MMLIRIRSDRYNFAGSGSRPTSMASDSDPKVKISIYLKVKNIPIFPTCVTGVGSGLDGDLDRNQHGE
jgi:hypothetical protein